MQMHMFDGVGFECFQTDLRTIFYLSLLFSLEKDLFPEVTNKMQEEKFFRM